MANKNYFAEASAAASVEVASSKDSASPAAARDEHRRLLEALCAGRIVSFEWDLASDAVVRSENADEIFGPDAARELGKDFMSHVHATDREKMEEVIRSLTPAAPEYAASYRYSRPSDGRELVLEDTGRAEFDSAGKMLFLRGLARDITKQRLADERLRESEERLRALVTASSNVIYRMSPDWAEMQFLQGSGYLGEAQAPEGAWLEKYILPEEQEHVMSTVHEAIRERRVFELEHRVRRKDGTTGWTFSRAIPLMDEKGEIVEWFGAATDITARKEAEAALRESEERYHTLADEVPSLVWWADADGHITWYNRRGYEYTGKTSEEMAGWGWQSVHDPKMLPTVLERWKESIATGKAFEMELRLRGADGQFRWFLSRVVPVKDVQGKVVRWFGANTDVESLKRAEAAVWDSQQKFRLLYEKAPLGIARIDSHTGRFLLINSKYCDILQRAEAEALQLDFKTVTHPDDLAQDLENMRRLRDGLCRSFEMDKRYLRPDGSIVWAHLTVVAEWAAGEPPSAHIAMVADITEKKRAEEALRASEERFRVAQELSPDGFTILRPVRDDAGDIVDFTWVYENATAERFTGKRFDEVAGRRLLDVFPGHRGTEFWEAYCAVAESGAGRVVEAHYLEETMTPKWYRIAVVPVGRDIAVLAQDVTERHEFYADLQRLVDERTAKLQELVGELEHFSYTITHDLKSPLRSMRGFAEMAGTYCERSEVKECLGRISTSAERMDRLIADALNYSQTVRQELPLTDVDAGALLRGMLDSYPEFQPAKAQIRVEGRLPVVLANEAGLTQCFSNLLGNAVKFVKPGEKPEIRLWSTEVPAHGRQPEWVRIWVEDKGIGISKEMLPRVFEMFSRGSKDHEGTGIGLALVRKVVQRMGGRVGVESAESQGSRFWIELGCGEARPVSPPAAARHTESGGEGTVLYVEDEESDAMFMERAFQQRGFKDRLRLVGTGRAAIDYLSGSGEFADREKYPVPSLVLLDLNLPQISGFGVLEWIRNHPDYVRLPVVVFSSSTREDDRTKARELGADEFVAKPNSGLDFGKVLDGLPGRWLGQGQVDRSGS